MRTNAVRHFAACAALCALLAARLRAGARCGAGGPRRPPPPGERHFPLTGEVVSVDTAKKVLVVRHNEVVATCRR